MSKYRSMKALLSGVAPGRAWNAGLECGHVLAHIPFTALLIASADRGQTINRVDATGALATPGLQGATYSPLNFMPAVKP